jgi:hydrogenase maturation protein HypF
MIANVERRRIRITGVVQGVGFRPFVYGLAERLELVGFVLNDGQGVVIEAEGPPDRLDRFALALRESAPRLARVNALVSEALATRGERQFSIVASTPGAGAAAIPPDVATCDDCLRELFDRGDRRFRYPFINCTQCGPRFTIVRRVPYDRANTTMAGFEMCADCRSEYEDSRDRRFHAEPNACPACGPRLSMPLEQAVALLRDGAILAVKGLGGYHLACDAADEATVARLRSRKHREDKPFAVMTFEPEALVELDAAEDGLLRGRARPIVLARRRAGSDVAASVAPGSPWLGVLLPYTPLHHLLVTDFGGALVMTSGNRSDEPIAFENGEARKRLGDIADAFLAHDRPIHRRCEDSVLRSSFPIRRSRGFVPSALPLPVVSGKAIVGAGAELKSTFCVARGREAFLSPHLGDLDSEDAYRAFRTDLALYIQGQGVVPELIAHDLHPEYLASKWALEQDVDVLGVQHHHAHAAACLAEHGETGPALALVFDGTGYGTDGTLWGGELLRCDLGEFERIAHLDPIPLPGGEAAIRQPWRVGAAYLERAGRPVPFERWQTVRQALNVNAPLSSGMGRLFDAVAALLGLRQEVTYEGQAAVELELLAGDTQADPYAWRFGDGAALVRIAHDDLEAGRPRREIAAAFHEAVAARARPRRVRRPAIRASSSSRAAASRTCACSRRRGPGSKATGPGAVPPAGAAERRRDQLRAGRRGRRAHRRKIGRLGHSLLAPEAAQSAGDASRCSCHHSPRRARGCNGAARTAGGFRTVDCKRRGRVRLRRRHADARGWPASAAAATRHARAWLRGVLFASGADRIAAPGSRRLAHRTRGRSKPGSRRPLRAAVALCPQRTHERQPRARARRRCGPLLLRRRAWSVRSRAHGRRTKRQGGEARALESMRINDARPDACGRHERRPKCRGTEIERGVRPELRGRLRAAVPAGRRLLRHPRARHRTCARRWVGSSPPRRRR